MPSQGYGREVLAGFHTDEQPGKKTIRIPAKGYMMTYQSTLSKDSQNPGYPEDIGLRDVGGAFEVSYGYNVAFPTRVPKIQGGSVLSNAHYEGDFYMNVSNVGGWGAGDGSAWAAEAYAKMRPDQPSFQGLNALYELKDLPGMLSQRLSNSPLRNIGNYFLAEKFGWEPLLRDIRNLCKTQMGAQDRLKQLLRDNGRPVRRRIVLRDNVSPVPWESTLYPGMWPTLSGYFQRIPTQAKSVQWAYDKVWASAQFRYWLPDGPRDINWTRSMMAKIFGLYPSPIAVYNAVPWSWLADWFTNAGYVISNMSGGVADRCAADYFYMMRQQALRTHYHASTGGWKSYSLEPVSWTCRSLTDQGIKTRVKGDPFGLATNQNSLTGMQLAILGALGLSRLR